MFPVTTTLRILPIHVIPSREDDQITLYKGEELESLIETLGGIVVERAIQKLDQPDNRTYIGTGKITEVATLVKEYNVDVVVMNAMAKPRQMYQLTQELRQAKATIQVWDRVDLILHIFDNHATTVEAKLQIELARMKYMGPAIYGMGFVLSRQGGGIGTSGIGETNTELMKRHWRKQMKKVTDQLEKISTARKVQLDRRKETGFKTISLVGYTNAGKSSLFNALTGKKTLVENALFATLDSTVGKLFLQELNSEVLITDTIGFIRDLPPLLIQAFKSTLMESLHADILIHVIDISDPEYLTKIQVVNEILENLGKNREELVYVCNKIDLVTSSDQELFMKTYSKYSPVLVSAKTGEGVLELQKAIAQRLLPIS